ncbi:MAG: lactate utilization protein C [Pseudonocardiales bacterium]
MSARDDVLARIREARAIEPVSIEVPRDYHGPGEVSMADPVALLTDRLEDYRARVRHCPPDRLEATIAEALAGRGARRVITPAGLPGSWAAAVGEPIADEPPLSTDQLDGVDGVITTVAVAIAQTGTIVLDGGPGQGRRALTLVPDYHLAVVRAEQIVPAVPDGVAAVDPTRPLTWISGPSATSDIELTRVEGVHGPRTLEVIIVS